MKVLDQGHRYELANLKSHGSQPISFFKDPDINGDGYPGCSCQEVIRVLIDRVDFLDGQQPAPENEEILSSLRRALMMFEVRALRKAIESGEPIENIPVGPLGHWFR